MLTLEELLNQTAVNTTEILTKSETVVKDTPENWKPKEAVTNARLVSFKYKEKQVPYAEVKVHYAKNKANKTLAVFICPKTDGHECVMCNFGWNEYNEAKKNGSKDKSFKRFLPTTESVSLIIERDTEEKDFTGEPGYPVLKCFKFPNKVREQIDQFLGDPEYGDITHLTKGTDIKINYNQAAAKEQLLSLTVTAARSSSPIFNKKFASVESDFETFRDVYEKMMENKCNPLSRYSVLSSSEILDVLGKMSEENSDREEVESHAAANSDNSNASEADKMAQLKKELSMF